MKAKTTESQINCETYDFSNCCSNFLWLSQSILRNSLIFFVDFSLHSPCHISITPHLFLLEPIESPCILYKLLLIVIHKQNRWSISHNLHIPSKLIVIDLGHLGHLRHLRYRLWIVPHLIRYVSLSHYHHLLACILNPRVLKRNLLTIDRGKNLR